MHHRSRVSDDDSVGCDEDRNFHDIVHCFMIVQLICFLVEACIKRFFMLWMSISFLWQEIGRSFGWATVYLSSKGIQMGGAMVWMISVEWVGLRQQAATSLELDLIRDFNMVVDVEMGATIDSG